MRYWTTLIAGIMGLVMLAAVAHSAEKTVAWDAVDTAVNYRLELSTDIGVTWTVLATVEAPATQAVLTVPDDTLCLMRAVAINAAGVEATNYTAGVFYHSGWVPPKPVAGLGITGE